MCLARAREHAGGEKRVLHRAFHKRIRVTPLKRDFRLLCAARSSFLSATATFTAPRVTRAARTNWPLHLLWKFLAVREAARGAPRNPARSLPNNQL